METPPSIRAGRLHWLVAVLLLIFSTSVMAGCLPPTHRSAPPAPPKPPGVWMPTHHTAPMA